MIGLDTNVLLRYLVQDDPVQSPRATEIISRRLTEEEPGFVSLVTILEVVWVLKSLYKRSREEIANDIEMVLAAETLEVQNEQEVSINHVFGPVLHHDYLFKLPPHEGRRGVQSPSRPETAPGVEADCPACEPRSLIC